ncbi:DUF7718 family protein [Halorussus amylolyticus]|uniref:DUF7718 family protein n=1 Tax=Halorussus amylolyticus TaxID=1126242 RepID=UPI00104CCE0F|nr:hypothetical protein [Halorussus amylolyticus]
MYCCQRRHRQAATLNTSREFGVIVHCADPGTGPNVEIARIDTAHGHVHIDTLYRRDEPKEPLDVSLWEAVARLKNDWRRYAESHERNR